ncbi:MAG TPA: hypothetical protein VMS25_00695, partial [Candidatus Limnocylindrales bacterium]|nr:hypothetical protein [Candidatus Limnocylindrales bacterium]
MLRVLYAFIAVMTLASVAQGAAAEDFYKGKTIRIVVGFSAGVDRWMASKTPVKMGGIAPGTSTPDNATR